VVARGVPEDVAAKDAGQSHTAQILGEFLSIENGDSVASRQQKN